MDLLILFCLGWLRQIMFHVGLDDLNFLRGLVALYDAAVTGDEEFGEVPHDVRRLGVVGVLLPEHFVQ